MNQDLIALVEIICSLVKIFSFPVELGDKNINKGASTPYKDSKKLNKGASLYSKDAKNLNKDADIFNNAPFCNNREGFQPTGRAPDI